MMFAKIGTIFPLAIIAALSTNNSIAAATTHLRGLDTVNDDLVIQPQPEVCSPGAECYVEGTLCAMGTDKCCGQAYDSLLCDCVSADGGRGFQYVCVQLDLCTDRICNVTDDNTNYDGNNPV